MAKINKKYIVYLNITKTIYYNKTYIILKLQYNVQSDLVDKQNGAEKNASSLSSNKMFK